MDWGSIIGGTAALGTSLYNMFSDSNKDAEEMAELNYNYNEMAADNAQERQNEFYQMTYDMNKPSTQVQNLKEAGLNPALMYGSGSGGTSGGSTGGTQGAGGGQQTAAAMEQAKAAKMQNSIAMAQAGAQIDLAKAQAKEHEANANRTNEDGENKWWDNFNNSVELLLDGETGTLDDDPGTMEALYKLFDEKPGRKISYKKGNMWEAMKKAGLEQALETLDKTESDKQVAVANAEANKIMADAAMKPYESFKMSDYKDMGTAVANLLIRILMGKK